jgi:hypothetical protein
LFGPGAQAGAQLTGTLTLVGLDSGARLIVPITVTKQ